MIAKAIENFSYAFGEMIKAAKRKFFGPDLSEVAECVEVIVCPDMANMLRRLNQFEFEVYRLPEQRRILYRKCNTQNKNWSKWKKRR